MMTVIINSYYLRYSLVLLTSFICTLYIFSKLSKITITKSKYILFIISSFVIPLFCAYLRINNVFYYKFIYMALTLIILFFVNRNKYYNSIPLYFISIGLSYGVEIISILIFVTLFYFVGYYEVDLLTQTCTSCFQLILTYFFMKLKRIKNGFTFLENKNNFGIGLLISGPIIILTNFQKEHMDNLTLTIFTVGIFISAIGLFLWIRSAFKRYYRKRLKLRAEEYSKIELAEKGKEIEKLSDENTSLSSIIHLDNHIIQSIESELKALNNTNLTDKLLTSINQRNEYVNDLLIKSKNLASTGNAEIDAVLLDLYIKSASRGIDYNLSADCDINYLINNIIPVSDFEALLRNLITNSIVDIENNSDTPGRISIKISQPNDIYELTVMDNGVFIDNNSIPDIVEKSNASILINKFDNNDSFTKSVTIRFDGMNIKKLIKSSIPN